MEKEIYKIIDQHIHRIAKITGQIVQEKEAYLVRVNEHIEDLKLARSEVLKLIEKLDE